MNNTAEEQRAGLETLLALARTEPIFALKEENDVLARCTQPNRSFGSDHSSDRGNDTLVLPAWQRARGALADHYEIPTVKLHRSRSRLYVLLAIMIAVFGLGRHVVVIWSFESQRPILIAWTLAFAFATIQWLLSWRDRPRKVTEAEQARLDRLNVVVNVPVFNEDLATVDRTIWSIVNQNRPVNRIDIIDDGSDKVDYSSLAAHWERIWPDGVEVRWVRVRNGGKKHAQAVTFVSAEEADIIATVDSDTALAVNAIEEGLKPFADRTVQSVAGIELAFNSGANWLTRTVSARSMFFQIVACGTQSIFGQILVNRGAYALYRAAMIRRIVPAYIGETFAGRPVKLGDDAALTLFASQSGRAVQQSSAFAFTMYPEKLSHHIRQWVRWMRGSTIRNCWRIKYLPMRSFGWWFTVLGYQTFLASTILPVLVIATWPASENFTLAGLSAMLIWGYIAALRITGIRRSDESWLYRLVTVGCYPAAMMWSAFVLRPLRFWGIFTFMKQGWTTRTGGVELAIETEEVTA